MTEIKKMLLCGGSPRLVLYVPGVWHLKLGRTGQIIHDQMDKVLVVDPVVGLFARLRVPHLVCAQHAALTVRVHADAVGCAHNALAAQDLAQVLRVVGDHVLGLAEVQRIVLEGQLRLRAGHLDGAHVDRVAVLEVRRRHAGHIEGVGGGEQQ